jgi:hypothetical protein
MTDIVERLRLDAEPTEGDMEEAATEIERLREALKFIVAYSDCHQSARDAARRALAKMKPFEDRWDNE